MCNTYCIDSGYSDSGFSDSREPVYSAAEGGGGSSYEVCGEEGRGLVCWLGVRLLYSGGLAGGYAY